MTKRLIVLLGVGLIPTLVVGQAKWDENGMSCPNLFGGFSER